jgi:lipopolysaccharide assembly outer membrane protein LptD (OstA)
MTAFWLRWLTAVLLALLLAAPLAVPQGNAIQPAAGTGTANDKAPPGAGSGAAKGQGSGASDTKNDTVTVEWADDLGAESMDGPFHLRGKVSILTRDARLICDTADYDRKASTVKASGHLKITDPSAVITGDLLDADTDKELFIVTGHVQIIAQKKADSQPRKPQAEPGMELSRDKGTRKTTAVADGRNKPGSAPEPNTPAKAPGKGKALTGKEARYRKTVVTCDRVEYYYAEDQKRMIATPRVKAVQQDRTVFADQAVYEDLPGLITLTGNVLIQTADGDEMRCEKAVVSVDDETVKAEKVSGTTLRKRKGEGPKPPPAPPTGSGEQPAPATPAVVPAATR